MAVNIWDFVKSINHGKEDILQNDVEQTVESDYVPFLVNRSLSFAPDTILFASEMNQRPFLDNKLQYHYLLNIVRPKRRFNKWQKSEVSENVKIIAEYFNYSYEKARQVESLLTNNDLEMIKQKLSKGGIKENK